jgi:hypothetical protein
MPCWHCPGRWPATCSRGSTARSRDGSTGSTWSARPVWGRFGRTGADVDFVAIVNRELRAAELRRLRALHAGRWASALIRDTAIRRRWPLLCNGIYITPGDLSRSPLDVTPLAGQVAGRFRVAPPTGFDVNPVTWHVLARHGIALRGPDREQLDVRTDEAELRTWVHANLNSYWRDWALRASRLGQRPAIIPPRRLAAWGVLGAPRLHFTLATGEIATKEAGAHYALDVFERHWHGLIEDALRWWHGEATAGPYRRHPRRRLRDTVEFVESVIAAGNRLASRVAS